MVEMTEEAVRRFGVPKSAIEPDPLEEWMTKATVPSYARVQIPLNDPYYLRHYSEILRGLAFRLESISREPAEKRLHSLWNAQRQIYAANAAMLAYTKSRGEK